MLQLGFGEGVFIYHRGNAMIIGLDQSGGVKIFMNCNYTRRTAYK